MNILFQELKCPICEKQYNNESRKIMTILRCGHNICKKCLDDHQIETCPFDSKEIKSEDNCILNQTLNNIFISIHEDKELNNLMSMYESITQYYDIYNDKIEKIYFKIQEVQEKYKILKIRLEDYKVIYNKKRNNNLILNSTLNEIKNINTQVQNSKADTEKKYNTWSLLVQEFIEDVTNNLVNDDIFDDNLQEICTLLSFQEEKVVKETETMSSQIMKVIEETSIIINKIQKITPTPKKNKQGLNKDKKYSTATNLVNKLLMTPRTKKKLEYSPMYSLKKREKTFVVAPFNLTERSNNTCYTKTEPNIDEKNEEMTHKIQKTDIDEHIFTPYSPALPMTERSVMMFKNIAQNNKSGKVIPIDEFLNSDESKKSIPRGKSYKTDNSDSNVSYSPTANGRDIFNGFSKDFAVFLKNQMKREVINCSGYNMGDNGCKALFQLKIKNNCENKNVKKCKELKISNCNITDNGMKYISAFLDMEGNNVTMINLSKNLISDSSLGNIINILSKNEKIKEIKLSNNLFSDIAKKKIKEYCNKKDRKIQVEL